MKGTQDFLVIFLKLLVNLQLYPQNRFFLKSNQVAIPGIVLNVEDRVKSKADGISYLISLRKFSGV